MTVLDPYMAIDAYISIDFISILVRLGIFYYSMTSFQQSTDRRKLLADDTLDSYPLSFNRLSEIKELPLYKQIERPNLKNEKLKSITDQLELEKKARQAFRNRQFHGNYMFNYDVNPFTEEFKIESEYLPKRQKKRSNTQIDFNALGDPIVKVEKNKDEKLKSILDEVKKYQNKKAEIRGNISKPLKDMMIASEKVSNTNQRVPKINSFVEKYTPTKQLPKSAEKMTKRRQNTEHFQNVLNFQQIVQMRDKNYYFKHEDIGNPFKFLRNPQLIHTKGKAILDTYYFCHNSIKEVVQKRKILIYRDISRLARHLMLERQVNQDKSTFLHVDQTNPNIEQYEISTIFSISAGRTKHHELLQFLMAGSSGPRMKEDQSTTTTHREHEIDYPENTANQRANKQESQENHDQAMSYLSMPYEEKESRFHQILLNQFSTYKRGLVEERLLISLNINDKVLHANLRKRGEQEIEQMLKGGFIEKDKDRLIRKNKMSKDRMEELRIKNMIEVMKSRNEHNKVVASMTSKARSKSNTPLSKSSKRI